jgi:hypothetical protein
MTQGRMRNGRYQQGISTPDTLGVQPTTWNEPKPPALFQAKFDTPNTGATRQYGATPEYVDTWKSRWEVPKPGNFMKGLEAKGTNMQNKAFDTESASRLGISTDELQARRAAGTNLNRFEADENVFNRTTAAGWTP